MPRSRSPDPDGYVLEPGRRAAARLTAVGAALVDPAEHQAREARREGARELDDAVERMPDLGRARRDRERAMPRNLTAAAGHPQTLRQLPEPDSVRRPLSERQRRVRSAAKRRAQDAMPDTQYRALSRLVTDTSYRNRLNDALSDAAGDAQDIPDADRVAVQRTDRAIGQYERENTRRHVVYANLEMPAAVPAGHTVRVLREHFQRGAAVSFDRFTGAAHQLHEIEPAQDASDIPVFEIETRRGIYLGRSRGDDTTHLLSRGLRFTVASEVHEAAYLRPDGSRGLRPVIQLRDLDTTEPAGGRHP
jgi:hypothetical protein